MPCPLSLTIGLFAETSRGAPASPCKFDQGLRSKFPNYKFKVSRDRLNSRTDPQPIDWPY